MSIQRSEKEAAGQLLDDLYLDMFHLVEEHTQCRINLERCNASGAILLARTRFQHGGSQCVSTAQIPTENSAEFNALCRVVDSTDGVQPPLTEAVAWASLRFSRLDTNSEKNKAPYETYKLR